VFCHLARRLDRQGIVFFILLGVNKSSIEDITKMNYIL